MADKKISELDALTGAAVATDDQLIIVDTSAGLTKNITIDEFKNALDTATGFVRITGDTMTGNLSFGDNDKAIFGAGSDLQIYHNGSHSIIADVGTGNLNLYGENLNLQNSDGTENYIRCTVNGAVDIRYDNATKLATSSTGIDVSGTVTADGLTVDGDGTVNITSSSVDTLQLTRTDVGGGTRILMENGNDNIWRIQNDGANVFSLAYNTTTAFGIASNGDISFYEDTGTTAKFFWDSSAERLGLGETSPDRALHIKHSTAASIKLETTTNDFDAYLQLETVDNTAYIGVDDSANALKLNATNSLGGENHLVITSAGNVGIGTSSPRVDAGTTTLEVSGSTTARAIIQSTGVGGREYGWYASVDGQFGLYDYTAAAERMRIDSSGNLLVGTTSDLTDAYIQGGGVGFALRSSDQLAVSRSAGTVAQFNRNTSDGDIVAFRKDGSTVGSIGAHSTQTYIGTGDTGIYFNAGNDSVDPYNTSTPVARSDAISLGAASRRFKDLYLSGGVVFGDAGGSGTSSSNTLDSYEEGTWTPSFGGSVGNPTVTYVTQSGFYRKVGDLVFVQGRMTLSAASGGSGSLEIDGMPFASAAGSDAVLSVSRLQQLSIDVSASGPIGILAGPNFVYYTSNTTGNHSTLQASHLTSTTSINFSGCYAV